MSGRFDPPFLAVPTDDGSITQSHRLSQRSDGSRDILPVTLRQVATATRAHSEAPFKIDGLLVNEVMTIAHVVRVRIYDSVTFLDIEDGTTGPGRVSAKRWRNGRETEGIPTDGRPFYAQIIGKIVRGAQETRNVLDINPVGGLHEVTDPHHVLFHILEVAFINSMLRHGPPSEDTKRSVGPRIIDGGVKEDMTPSAPPTPMVKRTTGSERRFSPGPIVPRPRFESPAPPSRPTTPLTPQSRATTEPPASPTSSPSASPPTTPVPSTPPRARHASARRELVAQAQASGSRRASGLRPDPYGHLTVLQRAILLLILNTSAATDSAEGVSVDTIVRGVAHHEFTTVQIIDALDELTEQGHIAPVDSEAKRYVVKTDRYPTSN
ncbi:hypothetical protein C8Q78DRAFT_1079344 [Trametes maxima]|nr:hypothetical protein C8Q78DRAFT_1079344 [Trametes maxima]